MTPLEPDPEPLPDEPEEPVPEEGLAEVLDATTELAGVEVEIEPEP